MGASGLRLTRLTLLLALVPAVAVFAETAREREAREDLERQLKSMVGTPPTKILVEVEGLDQPNYELVEASFRLDGRNLPVTDLKKLNSDGVHLIFHGDIEPGNHRLESKFEFQNMTSQVVSAEGGYKWKPGSEVSFKSASGIEVRIKVTPELNPNADLKNRITVKSPATVKMLAKLDDGSMPAPVERPKIVVAEGVDAGVTVVKAETAEEKAAAAAAAKKKAAEDALAAKNAAAEEKKRLADEEKAAKAARAEEARAAKLAAAEEKKRAASEALAAKAAAAEEKKRAADEAKAAQLAAAEEKKRAAAAPANTEVAAANPQPGPSTGEVDAGAAVAAEVVDAGPAAVAAAPPPAVVKPVEAAPVAEESGISPLMIGLGLAVIAVLVFLVARRKKKEP